MGPFDRRAVRAHRERAAASVADVGPLLEALARRVDDRVGDARAGFSRALDVGGRGQLAPLLRARGIAVWSADLSPGLAAGLGGDLAMDEEFLPFGEHSLDLITCLSLAWVNDVPGALIQMRRALRPGGLFVALVPALGTLGALRTALTEAEASLTGGAAPRVSPFPDVADCASLMQRAGFAVPVVDLEEVTLSYAAPLALLRDLRAAGETNALALRSRTFLPRAVLPLALSRLARDADGRMPVSVRLVAMTGWG